MEIPAQGVFSHKREYGEMTYLSTKMAVSLKTLIFFLKIVNLELVSVHTWEEILKHHFIGLI